MFKSQFKIDNKWELKGKSQLAYALLCEAVSKNAKLTAIVEKPENADGFIAALSALEDAIIDDADESRADESARDLKEPTLEALKKATTPDQLRGAIDAADSANGHLLRTAASGAHEISVKSHHEAPKVSLKRMAENPRHTVLSSAHGLMKLPSSDLGDWPKATTYVGAQVPLKTTPAQSQPFSASRETAL